MPKTQARLARERAAALEELLWYDEPIGPEWPFPEPPQEYYEKLRRREERREQARREREQRLALRIEKPTSTAHFVQGRYEPWGHVFRCMHCGHAGVTDRWQHDEYHRRSTPGAGVIMFLETLEALFGSE